MPERYDIVPRGSRHPAALGMRRPASASVAGALPPETAEPSLILPILRRWWVVLLFIALGCGVGEAYIKMARPLYSSTAKIYIQPAAGAVATALGTSERSNYLATQAAVISSAKILNRVAEIDGMREMKTFTEARSNPVLFLREELESDLERKTDLIAVTLATPYPQESAKIVETIVNAYIAYCKEEKDDLSQHLLKTYQDNKQDVDTQIGAQWQSIVNFRAANPTISALADNSHSLVMQELGMIDNNLNQLKIAELAMQAQYGQGHRVMTQIRDEQLKLKSMREEAMQKLTRESAQTSELQQMLGKLEQMKDMSKKLGEQVHQLQLTIGGRRLMDIEVVEPPQVADSPSYPRVWRVLSVAGVIGGLLGAGLALFMDRRDQRMRSVEEIQAVVGLPVLGVVPAMNGGRSAVARAMTVHLDPRSVVAEAYRTIRTAVFFGGGNSGCKTILVTSPEPGDGKTTSASNLAIAIAQTGRSVLLLDADFRKPTQHKNLEVRDSAGLSSVLAGHEPLERAVQRTQVDCLDILPCGPIPANPSEILNSREFGELIDSLVTRYDHILFDSPPVNPVTDARILGAICDSTILVLRADKSTRQSGEHARNALLAVGARLMGAIVNDAPRGKGYGVYGGSYYGSSNAGAVIPQRRLTSGDGQRASEPDSARRRNIA